MEDLGTGQVRIHLVVFFVMLGMYAIGLVQTDKFNTALLAYIAVMNGAIYFKMNRNGKEKDAGRSDSDASSCHKRH